MGVNWNDIISVPTKDNFVDKFVMLLRLAGFPVASWHSGSFQKHNVETESSLLSDVSGFIQKLGKGGFIRHAASVGDEWVDLCAEWFDEARKPAAFTQGTYTLSDPDGVGPFTIQPGAFWVGNLDGSLRFVSVNTTAVIVPVGGTAQITIQAESAGSQWNVGIDALTEILTPQPGLEGTNAPLETGTWITQQGADRETSASLVLRCIDKWATLGSGANEGAYRYRAAEGISEIARVKAYSPYGGAVRVTVAGTAGPVSASALATSAANVEKTRPLGVPDVATQNATVRIVDIVGVLTLPPNTDPNIAIANAQAAVDALARSTDIGALVDREEIIWAIKNTRPTGLELSSPPTDFQLTPNEIWVPRYALTAA